MVTRGVLGSVLVLVGSLVTEVLPGSSRVATAGPVAALRDSATGRAAGLVVVAVGLGLLAWAWLELVARTASAGRTPTNPAPTDGHAGLRTIRVAAATWCAPLLLAPPLFSRDGWSYAAQGVLTHLGLSPYVWTPSLLDGPIREGVDPLWWNTPAPYGPLPLGWGAGVASVTSDPWLMVVGYRLLALVGLALLAWAVPRLAGWTGVDPVRASAVMLASPLTLVHGVGGLHNDLAMAGLMAAALAWAGGPGRWGWLLGAAAVGAAAAIKVPGGAVAIGVALVSLPLAAPLPARIRRLGQVGAVASAVLLGSGLIVGVGAGWVHALGVPASVGTPLSVTTRVGDLTGLVTPARVGGLALAAALAVGYAVRGRTGDRSDAVRWTALTITAVVVLGPAVREWYLLWALPFVAVVPWRRPLERLVRDLALVLGVAAPLHTAPRGETAEVVVVAGLVVLAAARVRGADPRAAGAAGAAGASGSAQAASAERPTTAR